MFTHSTCLSLKWVTSSHRYPWHVWNDNTPPMMTSPGWRDYFISSDLIQNIKSNFLEICFLTGQLACVRWHQAFLSWFNKKNWEEEKRERRRKRKWKKKDFTSVGQQVGGQQAGEAWVKQPGAFLDPSTRTTLRRTAWTRAGGGDGERGRERERSMTQNLNHRNYRLIQNKTNILHLLVKVDLFSFNKIHEWLGDGPDIWSVASCLQEGNETFVALQRHLQVPSPAGVKDRRSSMPSTRSADVRNRKQAQTGWNLQNNYFNTIWCFSLKPFKFKMSEELKGLSSAKYANANANTSRLHTSTGSVFYMRKCLYVHFQHQHLSFLNSLTHTHTHTGVLCMCT